MSLLANTLRSLKDVRFLFRTNRAWSEQLQIVSATDESHYRSFIRLWHSVRKYSPGATFTLYDLGLEPHHRSALATLGVTVKRFPFENYPDFFDMKRVHGSYAWKPSILELEIRQCQRDVLLWMDAGCLVTSSFSSVVSMAQKYRVIVNPSASNYRGYLHPTAAIEFERRGLLKTSREATEDLKMLSAAFIGFWLPDPQSLIIARSWAAFAKERDVIGPDGATSANHRFDQVLLDALIQSGDYKCFPYRSRWAPSWILGILTHRDVEFG